MKKAFIFDIDGTLADASHRLHHIQNGNKDWDAFFASVGDDIPVDEIIWLCMILKCEGRMILCSGRPEKFRPQTESWLADHGIEYDELHMRPDGDHRPDYLIKGLMLDRIQAEGNEIAFVVDDRPSVVKMWRERGLTCLQCSEWNESGDVSAKPGLLTVMVGPSGAGKTTFLMDALEYGIHHSHIVSSDRIRIDLCGDFRDQTQNAAVFAAVTPRRKRECGTDCLL